MSAKRSVEELSELWQAFAADRLNVDLRNQIAEHYLYLVKHQSGNLWARLPEGVELDDMYSAGVLGLMDAIDTFDLARGIKFGSYSALRIRGAMLDELRNMDHVPRLVRMQNALIKEVRHDLTQCFGRPASDEEVAQALAMSQQEFTTNVLPTAHNSLSYDFFETDTFKKVDREALTIDRKAPHADRGRRQASLLQHVLRGLNRQERLIVIEYYFHGHTMKQIGEGLGLSESRVSQMHAAVLARLGHRFDRVELFEFLS